MVDFGKTYWLSNGKKRQTEEIDSTLKGELPQGKLFTISSKLFNIEKHAEEIFSTYNCVYVKDNETLCLILDEKVKYADFSREIIVNLIEFAQKIGVNLISLLVCRNNKDYVKFIQGMMTVGFEQNKDVKSTKIDGKIYRILSLNMANLKEEIQDVEF